MMFSGEPVTYIRNLALFNAWLDLVLETCLRLHYKLLSLSLNREWPTLARCRCYQFQKRCVKATPRLAADPFALDVPEKPPLEARSAYLETYRTLVLQGNCWHGPRRQDASVAP